MSRNELIAGVGLLGLFILAWYYQSYNENNLLRSGNRTEGIIIASGRNITVSFKARSTIYTNVLLAPYHLQVGEKFMLAYDPKNPKSSIILFWQPVFDKKQYASTKAIEVHKPIIFLGDRVVQFSYMVAGREYKRTQTIAPKNNNSRVCELYVLYNKYFPQIAYLCQC